MQNTSMRSRLGNEQTEKQTESLCLVESTPCSSHGCRNSPLASTSSSRLCWVQQTRKVKKNTQKRRDDTEARGCTLERSTFIHLWDLITAPRRTSCRSFVLNLRKIKEKSKFSEFFLIHSEFYSWEAAASWGKFKASILRCRRKLRTLFSQAHATFHWRAGAKCKFLFTEFCSTRESITQQPKLFPRCQQRSNGANEIGVRCVALRNHESVKNVFTSS